MIWAWHKHVIEVAAIVLGRIDDDDAKRRVAAFFVWYAEACHRFQTGAVDMICADYRDCVPKTLWLEDVDVRRMLKRIGRGTPLEMRHEFYASELGQAPFERSADS